MKVNNNTIRERSKLLRFLRMELVCRVFSCDSVGKFHCQRESKDWRKEESKGEKGVQKKWETLKKWMEEEEGWQGLQ